MLFSNSLCATNKVTNEPATGAVTTPPYRYGFLLRRNDRRLPIVRVLAAYRSYIHRTSARAYPWDVSYTSISRADA